MNNIKLPEKIICKSEAILTSIKFDNNDILKVMRSLNVNTAYGHDGILVRMIKCVMTLGSAIVTYFQGLC